MEECISTCEMKKIRENLDVGAHLILVIYFYERISAPRWEKNRWKCEWNIMRKWVVDKPTDTAKIGTTAVCARERMIKRCRGSCSAARDHVEGWRLYGGCWIECGEIHICWYWVCESSGGVNIFYVFVRVVCVVLCEYSCQLWFGMLACEWTMEKWVKRKVEEKEEFLMGKIEWKICRETMWHWKTKVMLVCF